MLITESQMSFGRNLSAFDILDNIEYLSESAYAPAMVPVVENSRLQSYLIDIEDLTAFAESNGIEDLGYALQLVCEADDLDPSHIAFTVDKVTLFENNEIADLVNSLINENVQVVSKPLSSSSTAYILGESFLNYALQNDDWSLLESFISDDIFSLNEGGSRKRNLSKAAGVGKRMSNGNPSANNSDNDESNDNKPPHLNFFGGGNKHGFTINQPLQLGSGKPSGNIPAVVSNGLATTGNGSSQSEPLQLGAGSNPQSAVKNAEQVLKDAETKWSSKPRKWIAEKLAWLHDKVKEFNDKVKSDGKNAKWWKKIASYFTRAIQFLTRKLHNAVAEKGFEISDPDDKNQVNGGFSSFKK